VTLALREERIALAYPLWSATKLTWSELPRVIAASAIAAVAWIPLVIAVAVGAVALVPLAAVPAAVAASGFAQAVAPLARGERLRVRRMLRVDVLWTALAVVAAAAVTLAILADGGIVALAVGATVTATALVVLPLAAAYGALRDRRGLAALRGALVIAAVRPSVALSVLAVGVLSAFAVAATVGVLALAVPAIHVVYTAALAARVVDMVNGEDRS
jgi:hypothetical protein